MSPARFTERELRLPADFARIAEARAFAEETAAAAGFDADGRYAIRTALAEAVANAIEHGSRGGEEIELRAAVEGDSLVLYVRDRGTFVPRVAPRGDLPERGRGLEFMGRMMDELQIEPSAGGTLVRLARRLPGA